MPNRGVLRTLTGVCLAAASAMANAAAVASAAEVPRPSPDFAINMTDGQKIVVSQYKGKVCVLAFILTTGPRCQNAHLAFVLAHQNFLSVRHVDSEIGRRTRHFRGARHSGSVRHSARRSQANPS